MTHTRSAGENIDSANYTAGNTLPMQTQHSAGVFLLHSACQRIFIYKLYNKDSFFSRVDMHEDNLEILCKVCVHRSCYSRVVMRDKKNTRVCLVRGTTFGCIHSCHEQ